MPSPRCIELQKSARLSGTAIREAGKTIAVRPAAGDDVMVFHTDRADVREFFGMTMKPSLKLLLLALTLLLAAVVGCEDSSGSSGGSSSGSSSSGSSSGGSTLDINDPLYQDYTETTAEWITSEWYACEDELSACGLPCPADDLWVAINSTDFRDSATCSACMHVIGPLGEVTVEVIENCGSACVDGEIELSQGAFAQIGDLAEGHAEVQWKLVPCERSGPIRFSYEADSNEWWAGIQIRNPALPVASLAIRYSDEDGWVELSMDGWNHFPVSADLGSGPFDFIVTAIDGQQLHEDGIDYAPGGEVPGTGQFEI